MVPWQALIDDAMKDLPIGTEEAKRCQDRIIRLGWGLSFPTLKLWRQAVRREVPRCLGAVQKFGFCGCGMLERWIFRLILVHDRWSLTRRNGAEGILVLENVGNKILALRRFRKCFGTLPLSTLDFWIPTPDFLLVVWTGWYWFSMGVQRGVIFDVSVCELLRSPGLWTGFAFASLDFGHDSFVAYSPQLGNTVKKLLRAIASFALIQPDVCHLYLMSFRCQNCIIVRFSSLILINYL